MRKLIALFLVLVMTLCVTVGLADAKLTITGSGETMVPADVAFVSLGVNVRDMQAPVAQSRANEIIAKIREALKSAGFNEEDVNTGFINLYGLYDYSESSEKLIGYNASSNLSVRVTDMARVGEVIDLAFKAGANSLDGVTFSVTDDAEARKQSLKAAVEDAKTKAEVLAEAAGFTELEIESIQEGSVNSFDSGLNNFSKALGNSMDFDEAARTVVRAAKISISASVTITFVMK